MKTRNLNSLVLVALLLAACSPIILPPSPTEGPGPKPTPTEHRQLTVMTHDSFAVSEDVVAAFEEQYNATVTFLKSGDVGEAVNKAVLAGDQPLADVFYGVDNTFLSRALDGDIFEIYDSPLLAKVPDEFDLDPGHRALPVDYGDVCVNYDKAWFADAGIAPPANLEALLQPEYQGLLTVENPATSSPGLAFLLATIGHFGPDAYLDYWQGLLDNGVHVVNDWETAYYTEFSRWGGEYPLVVSYGSSPPAEVIFAEQPLDDAPTASVVADDACFRQIEFVGILKGTQQRDLAEKWVDFMLSTTFQEDMPLQMFVFPVNEEAQLPQEFIDYVDVPAETAVVNPADIAAHREEWIQAWTDTVLR